MLITIILSSTTLADDVEFNRQIRPILSRHCIACHGPDGEQRQAGFRVDVRDEALAAIEPGDSEASDLVIRIMSEDEGERMPPPEHGEQLSPSEVEILKTWIDQGANFEKHWSFVTPKKPSVPQMPQEVKAWAANEVDSFVALKLANVGLKPSVPEESRRLIRRLALDLTGLPPTQEMVKRFSEAPTNEAYEQIVDELLATPAYGEHWAAMWLDIARYADTTGYAEDKARTIWPWRDWVIRAFNSNLPFDQFTLEQIAGDLIPDATDDQILATAFHRNTLVNTEGGTSDEEFRVIAVKDRINTTVNAWMGLTMRCAECHTHKYDPISQKEYYQFLDFFNQTEDSDHGDERPLHNFFPVGRAVEFAQLDKQIEEQRKLIAELKPVWRLQKPSSVTSRDGATMTILDDHSVVATGKNPDFDKYELNYLLSEGTITGVRLEAITSDQNDGNLGRADTGAFVVSQFRASMTNDKGKEISLRFSEAVADHSQPDYGIELAIREEMDDAGWAVNHPIDGFRVNRTGVLTFEKPLELSEPTEFTFIVSHKSPLAGHNLGRLRLAWTDVSDPEKKYKSNELEPERLVLKELVKKRNAPVRVPVMKERALQQRRKTHLMIRGSYLQPGEEVSAAVMESFHPLPESATRDRLGVGKWLLSEQNPLTARVAVNRFWARIFGVGIVETEEDFGIQGSYPSHPNLLDWLAVDFRENGWDVKRLLKQLVTSSTYRQTGVATAEQLELDPRNVLLSRGPRFRLRAEVIRDQALSVSGLLSTKKFGPPVYPPNPVKKVRSAFQGESVWMESEGEDRYRRALYTFLKRSAPHPLFDTFDMATREVCNMRRIRTNTPLQSFMTLNDSSFVEAAQAMAKKMYESDASATERIAIGFQMAVFREPNEAQSNPLLLLYEATKKDFETKPDSARTLAGVDHHCKEKKAIELAALTVVANVILNLDAFLTK